MKNAHILRQGYLRGGIKFPVAPDNTIILTFRDPEFLGETLEGKWVTTLSIFLTERLATTGVWEAVMDFITYLRVKYYVNERFSPYTTDPIENWSSFNIIVFDSTGISYPLHLDNMEIKIVETLTSQTQYKVEVINGGPEGAPLCELPAGSYCLMHSFISAEVKGERWAKEE